MKNTKNFLSARFEKSVANRNNSVYRNRWNKTGVKKEDTLSRLRRRKKEKEAPVPSYDKFHNKVVTDPDKLKKLKDCVVGQAVYVGEDSQKIGSPFVDIFKFVFLHTGVLLLSVKTNNHSDLADIARVDGKVVGAGKFQIYTYGIEPGTLSNKVEVLEWYSESLTFETTNEDIKNTIAQWLQKEFTD